MKKLPLKKLLIIIIPAVLLVTAGVLIVVFTCFKDKVPPVTSLDRNKYEVAEYVAFEESSLTLAIGDSYTLSVKHYVKNNPEVQFSSSDSTVLEVSENGIITALKRGSAQITAVCGGLSDTIIVTCDFGGISGCIVSENIYGEEVSVAVGESLDLGLKVFFNGVYFDFQPVITVEDESLLTVEGGKISPKKSGTSKINIGGTFSGVSLMPVEITVKVKNVIEVIIKEKQTETSVQSINIYTMQSFGGKEYSNKFECIVSAKFNGEEIPTEDIRCELMGNTDIVRYNTSRKLITAKSRGGRCNYSVTFERDGVTYGKVFDVNVSQPVAVYEKAVPLDVSKGELPINDIFNATTVLTEVSSDFGAYVEDNKVFGFTVYNETPQNITVYNGSCGYALTVIPYTRIITTAQDLKIFHFENLTDVMNGYYILGNDIDASGYTHQNNFRYAAYGISQYPEVGFIGTFDGKGHTISGITLGQSGLFGAIGNGATVKNVGFENVKFSVVQDTATLATYINEATVKNVYIHAEKLENANTKGYRSSLVAYAVSIKCNITDCVFVLDSEFETSVSVKENWDYGSFTGLCPDGQKLSSAGRNFLRNCYVISPTVMTHKSGDYIADTSTIYGKDNYTTYIYPNVKHYVNYVEMKSANLDLSAFDEKYWEISSGYPVWKI